MDELLAELKNARLRRDNAACAMKDIISRAEESAEYTEHRAAKNSAAEKIIELEAQIWETALAHYAETGEKQINDFVSIAVSKKFEITDPAAVMAWCVQNYAAAVVTAVDEKLVKDLALFNVKKNHAQIDGVVVTDVPQVRIGNNL